LNSGLDVQPKLFDITGVVIVGYALFAFMLGAALGAVIHKPGWAFAAGVPIFALVRLRGRRSTIVAGLARVAVNAVPDVRTERLGAALRVSSSRTNDLRRPDERGSVCQLKRPPASVECRQPLVKPTAYSSLIFTGSGSTNPRVTTGRSSGRRRRSSRASRWWASSQRWSRFATNKREPPRHCATCPAVTHLDFPPLPFAPTPDHFPLT
jgi:hypothetical protein